MQPLIAGFFGGWEIVLLLALVVIFLGAGGGFFGRSTQNSEEPGRANDTPGVTGIGASLTLWMARGFDLGCIPFAPGTFGSALGLLWFAILLLTQTLWVFLAVAFAALLVSVWICGKAERILNQRDPGSIVLDEVCAMPLCFIPWLASEWFRKGEWPTPDAFFGEKSWYITAIIFVLFRVFDILKPWPVRQSQKLPGGWGVVMDDVLAALYVCALSLIVFH